MSDLRDSTHNLLIIKFSVCGATHNIYPVKFAIECFLRRSTPNLLFQSVSTRKGQSRTKVWSKCGPLLIILLIMRGAVLLPFMLLMIFLLATHNVNFLLIINLQRGTQY